VRLSAQAAALSGPSRTDRLRLVAMMGLFFLVVCAVGILRPIKNSLALDGLGSTSFYKVYLVSAIVILFVPIFNRAADRFSWQWLLPGVAIFFALNLVAFRLLYVDGSAAFGLGFYGWYDLFSAALVTQFFMATQLFFDARSAKRAYPLVIAGGSVGATVGGALTGFFAESMGTPNLLLVAAGLIMVFAVAMPWVWGNGGPENRHGGAPVSRTAGEIPKLDRGELRTVFSNRYVQLIAGTVLLTILVKQLVDFQFNVLTKEVFESRDAISAFQGKFNAATQWLPLIVLGGLRPALRRWGVGLAVMLLPLAMFGATAALAIAYGLWAAVAAKGADGAFRYSAERTGREILYVPVPDEIKLKAKAYIDVAIEKGAAKVLSALLLGGLLTFLELRHIAFVSAGLALLWLALAVAVRREYTRALASAIHGRFASTRGLLMSLTDANSLPVLREALDGSSALRTAFGLELLAQAPTRIWRCWPGAGNLIRHDDEKIRAAALGQLARTSGSGETRALRECLRDTSTAVREVAVRALVDHPDVDPVALLRELLSSGDPEIRMAALAYAVAAGTDLPEGVLDREYFEARRPADADADVRAELALAASGLAERSEACRLLDAFLVDPDPRVRSAALLGAARLGRTECCEAMIAGLASAHTRDSAHEALLLMGAAALDPLARALLDTGADAQVRRAIPNVLAGIPEQRTVDALLRLVLAPETDQLLDFRTIKALGKLRAGTRNSSSTRCWWTRSRAGTRRRPRVTRRSSDRFRRPTWSRAPWRFCVERSRTDGASGRRAYSAASGCSIRRKQCTGHT
jgi:ATP:ADP antiporter, AAA family